MKKLFTALALLLSLSAVQAQIFLLGAEFTWVYAFRHGSRRGEKTGAAAHAADPPTLARPVPGKGIVGNADADFVPVPDWHLARRTSSRPSGTGLTERGVLQASAAVAAAGAVGWVIGKLTDRSVA